MMKRSSAIFALSLAAACLVVSASTPTFLPARLVIDLNTVPIAVDSAPMAACSGAGVAYFQANYENGITGLWKSDGSTAGTTLVKRLGAVGGQTYIHCLGVSAAGPAYFAGSDATHGLELWRSDGTADGTIPLTTFTVFTLFVSNHIGVPAQRQGDLPNGDELWVSDGTVAGTHILVDLTPGSGGSFISTGALWGSEFYFRYGGNPWKTDGTAAGTVKIETVLCVTNV
jgi:ELWxxDGT repeat protein